MERGGHGLKQDGAEARKWYRTAATYGSIPAMVRIGNCMMLGTGGEKNLKSAKYWFELAQSHGSKDAVEALIQLKLMMNNEVTIKTKRGKKRHIDIASECTKHTEMRSVLNAAAATAIDQDHPRRDRARRIL